MFNLYYIHRFILFFFLLTTACQLEQIQIEDWSPEFVTPLINTRITIADLIPEEGSTQYDQHGFISLAVKDDSVYVLTPELLISVPDQIAVQEEFLFDDLPINDFVQDTIFNLEALLVSAVDNDPAIATLVEQFGIEITAVVGKYKLKPLFCRPCTGGFPSQQFVDELLESHGFRKSWFASVGAPWREVLVGLWLGP